MAVAGTVDCDSPSGDICPQELAALGFTPASADNVTQESQPKRDRKEWKRRLVTHVCFADDISFALESGKCMHNCLIPGAVAVFNLMLPVFSNVDICLMLFRQ